MPEKKRVLKALREIEKYGLPKLSIAFEPEIGHVFVDEKLVSTFNHPYREDYDKIDVASVGGSRFLVVHPNYPPYELFQADDNSAIFRKIDFGIAD